MKKNILSETRWFNEL